MNPDPPSSQAVLEALLERHQLADPDQRRPLYQYGVRSWELEQLRHALREELGRQRPGRWTAMGFCLWASEWWRRNYEGGPWKWRPLLAELDHLEFEPGNTRYSQLQDMVSRGLGAWKRPVLQLASTRRYLATLACEGGLPLSLLEKDTHLRKYMRAVMEEYDLFRSSGMQPHELAEQAQHFLPRSWRQDVVYELAGRLVRKIWRLQQELGESDTPVIDLDRIQPGWRDKLPVRITDDIARTLLNGLLLDAAEVVRGGSVRVRWEVEVIPVDNDQWEARGFFQMPSTMDSAIFNRLFGRANDAPVPDRFDLCAQVHGKVMQPLAIVTRHRGTKNGAFGVELLSPARKHHRSGLEQPRELMARSPADCFRTSGFPGAGGLTQLPWVFAPKDAGANGRQPCRLVGQGSVKIREPWGLVAVPRGVGTKTHPDALTELAGDLRNADRRMYRVTGRVVFEAADGSRTVVETGARSSTAGTEYRLHGRQTLLGRNGSPVYLGKPQVREWHDGTGERVPEANLEWKSDVTGSCWTPYATSEGIRGNGVLRYTKEGEVRHTTKICVLPPEANVEIHPSSDWRRGKILLCGFGEVRAAVDETVEIHTRCYPTDRAYCLDLSVTDDAPYEVTVIVSWLKDGRAELRLPFPIKRSVFRDRRGNELPCDITLAVDRLTGIRAEVVIPPDAAEFEVQGNYTGKDPTQLRQSYGFFFRVMEEVSPGHHTLDLALVQLAAEARLSPSDDDPGGQVVLRIQGTESLPPTRIRVGRFDLELQALNGPPVVFRLPLAHQAGMSADDLAELEIEMISLSNPSIQPIALVRAGDCEWSLPEEAVNPGPYLLTGRQGDWQRVRPVFWYAGKRLLESLPEASCERAYSQWSGDYQDLEMFRSVASRLANQPNSDDPDWELVFAYLNEKSLSVQVFPLLRALAESSEACAMAAVVATRAQFQVLWERMVALPFAWWQVPTSSWRTVLTRYAEHLEEALDDLEQAEDIVARETTSRIDRLKGKLPGLNPAFEFMGARLLGSCIPSEAARIANTHMLDGLQKEYGAHRRKSAVLQTGLPGIPRLPGICSYTQTARSSTRCAERLFANRVGPFSVGERADYVDAPAATAVSVLSDHPMPHGMPRAVRKARAFDTEWFDEALRLALLIGFGRECADGIQKNIG